MRRTQWLFIASALVAVLAGFRQLPDLDDLAQAQPGSSSSSSPQAIDKWDRPEPRRGEVLANLKRATVVESRPSAAGYDRDCGTGHACSFGPAWTDDVDTEFARIAESGATVVTKPETEPWGERYCQFADPNGIIWQLVHWVSEPA